VASPSRLQATPTYSAGVVARLAIGQFQLVEDDVTACPVLAGLW